MRPSPLAHALHIRTRVSHTVRTATLRDDLVGWVVTGRKRLIGARGELCFARGDAFLIPRATQWDVVNEAAPGGGYEARLMSVAPELVERFHQRFGQFSGLAPVQGCAGTRADDALVATLAHASSALQDAESSQAVQEHRALEVLLLLAERGLVFAPPHALGWADRVQRLVGQRPQADWSVEAVARAFHVSASTLQRRLGEEGSSVSRCVREVRLETAMALLQGSELPVSLVAARCGYESHSRFTAAFKQRYGYAPSHLRP